MILTGNSRVNQRLDMTRSPKINGQSPLRKRDANRPSARKRIFDTASELFYLKGIRAVGVETIAAEADTTRMSLYGNVTYKDELVQAHLGRIGLRGNRLHPDRPDSLEVEELRRRIEDAFAGARAVRVAFPERPGMRLPVGFGQVFGHVQS